MNSESVANDKNKLNLFGVGGYFVWGKSPNEVLGQVRLNILKSIFFIKKHNILIIEKVG